MSGITQEERKIKKEVLDKCWQYIRDNFHKLKEDKKIRVSLELIKKDMPQQLEHSGEIKGQNPQIIIVRNKKEAEKIKNEQERSNRVQSDGEAG